MKSWLGVASVVLFALAPSTVVRADDALLCAFEPGPEVASMLSLDPLPARGPEPAPMCEPLSADPSGARDLSARAGRLALERADATEDPAAALVALDLVAEVFPRLGDLIDLRRGERHFELGAYSDARDAFARARDASFDSQVLVLARVGYTRSLLAMGHRDATDSLRSLLRRYPDLPEEPALEFAMAQYQEGRGRTAEAIQKYRALDVRHPGTGPGRAARARLEAMEDEGVDIRPMPPIQRVERAERLLRRGPLDEARTELAALEAEPALGPTHRARVYFALATIARHEGRWADARAYLARGSNTGAALGDEEDQARRTQRSASMAEATVAREREEAARRIRQLRGRTPMSRIGTARVMLMARVAARAGLSEELDELGEELVRRNLHAGLRLRVALDLVGSISDERLLALLDGLERRPGTIGMQSLYHSARALQRLGRFAEAEHAFQAVIERDRGITPFYKMWAELQLEEMHRASEILCGGASSCEETAAQPSPPRAEGSRLEATMSPEDVVRTEPVEAASLEALAVRLHPLVERHGEALPWLGRAHDLLLTHDASGAGRQLYEAMIAWREAIGRAIRRAGLESVARGDNRARVFVDFATRRARRAVPAADRELLSEIAAEIGDIGAATGWGGWDAVAERPRAYAAEVEAAAMRHGLDPNLLFAIMRVESVYQKDIVSYAGAIGLCQIMPRTGQLIAAARGKDDYTVADLLDPQINLDFAAWYLRSLIERFDGHVPLAIASYNGGPHNVRRWLEDHAREMPLDAFLEHIPFDQTHRYVRRVLTHYRAYRAQQGLPMIALSTTLPAPGIDPVAF